MNSSPKDGKDDPTVPGGTLTITMAGYVPPSQNALRNAHWSDLHREKRRACVALMSTLSCMLDAQWTGITCGSKDSKTALQLLASSLAMAGTNSKAGSPVRRFTRKRKKELKSE